MLSRDNRQPVVSSNDSKRLIARLEPCTRLHIFAGLFDSPVVNILCIPVESNLQINGLEPVPDQYDSWQAARQRLRQAGVRKV